jgi:putative aminopeptidase FrvX
LFRFARSLPDLGIAKGSPMNRTVRIVFRTLLFTALSAGLGSVLLAQQLASSATAGGVAAKLGELVATTAVSGYESQLSDKLVAQLTALHPAKDNLGDVVVTLGSGSPRRLLVAPIDEPGFVVSEITPDGYLRVQRLPPYGFPPIFNEMYSAQPVKIGTATGGWVDGVFAGLSIHLQPLSPERTNVPSPSDIDAMYVDIGATSDAEVRKAGVDLLSPIAIGRRLYDLAGKSYAGPTVGDRFGAAALLEVLAHADPAQIKGTLIVAFVTQQRTGARGLRRILTTIPSDEMIFVGRLTSGGAIPGMEAVHRGPRRDVGSGVLVAVESANDSPSPFALRLKDLAAQSNGSLESDYSSSILPRSYLAPPPLPENWGHIGIATAWPDTPAETIDARDLSSLVRLLETYTVGAATTPTPSPADFPPATAREVPKKIAPGAAGAPPTGAVLADLIRAYGASTHEEPVRERVKALLPKWAQPETDDAGNLILRVGTAQESSKAPRLFVLAHMDEIGYSVKSISKDGCLEVEELGSGLPYFYQGHPVLVHTAKGDRDGVIELPKNWDATNFKWPEATSDTPTRVDVGAKTPEEVAKLGISIGDTITIAKAYRPLLGTRANGRSFDDRVGCAALISAVWSFGGALKNRDVTFVWSTGEELGLVGAAKLAARLAKDGGLPDYVFAVDTFVSSDSPLESKRYGDAEIGRGFVVRAVDSSNVVPLADVQKIVKLARANQIAAQYGVTSGGNDGSTFVRYGSIDVALGWPLRYSHSPAEVIDTRDVESLARILAVVAKSW